MYPMRMIDGKPIDPEYAQQLKELMNSALDAADIFTQDELEAASREYARQMETQRKEAEKEETKNAG